MTREKEIRKEAIEVTHFAQFGHSGRDMAVAYDAFILGAKWADEHPKEGMANKQEFIEKVKAWLKNNIDEDVFVKCGNVVKIMDAHDFSEYFCKVMEE